MKAVLYLINMSLGNEKFMTFQTQFTLYKYMVMLFSLTNAPATFQ